MSTKGFFVLLLAAMLTACVSTPKSKFGPVSASTRAALQDAKQVSVEVAEGKRMSHITGKEQAMMSTGVFFGAIGAAVATGAAISSANKRGATLEREDALVDPSKVVAAKMSEQLRAQGLEAANQGDIRMRLTTTNWTLSSESLGYFSSLDVAGRGGRILTRGECKYLRKMSEIGASTETLLANSGAQLKAEYDKAADYCATYFTAMLFPK